MTVDHRITELELRYMSLEQLAHELSGVVAEQQKTIAALAADVAMLSARADDLRDGRPAPPADERPPHY